jgi:hypothetical protein
MKLRIRRADQSMNKSSQGARRTKALRDRDEIEEVIRTGANSLFKQQRHVDNIGMFTGGSTVAEANIVIHIAHSFLKNARHSVWSQSFFRDRSHSKRGARRSRSNWLDLVINLNTGISAERTVVLIEAKRIAPGERATKIREVIQDWKRIRSWVNLPPASVQIGYSLDPIKRAYGAIVVLIPEEPSSIRKNSNTAFPTLEEWWKNLQKPPRNRSGRLFRELASMLKNATKGSIRSAYVDGGKRTIILYAIFGARSK